MLSQRKVEQLLGNQSNTARKLYELMTVEDKWTVHQVVIEFKKNNNDNVPDRKVVSGCLNDLTDTGLLKRTGQDLYSKAPVRKAPAGNKDMIARMVDPISTTARPSVPKSITTPTPVVMNPPVQASETMSKQHAVKTVQKPADTMSTMLTMAGDITAMANNMLAMAKQIEDLALELEAEREKVREKSKKVDTLTELLRSFQND